MKLRSIDCIWHVRGSVALPPGQSNEEAFDRLDPLFREIGTTHDRIDDMLIFQKKDPAAQDKMSVFSNGVLRIERLDGGSVLRYDLTSKTLLFCFLLPVLFIGIAQLTLAVGRHDKQVAEAAEKAGKKKPEVKKPDVPMNPIDKALGAPEPEKKKDGDDESGGRKKKPSATAAYVFAGIFATLYVIGRILEDRLVNALFRKRLFGS